MTTFPEVGDPCKLVSSDCKKLVSDVPLVLAMPSVESSVLKLDCSADSALPELLLPLVALTPEVAVLAVAAVVPVAVEEPALEAELN